MWIDEQVIARCHQACVVRVFFPSRPCVVLGRGNRLESEVHGDACRVTQVPILRRLGGGGTVVLSAATLVLSVGTWVRDPFANDRYFYLLNESLIAALVASLAEWDVAAPQFAQAGISDVVVGTRKLAGTSLFRSRNYLLYQASVLVGDLTADIERLLAHPSCEPAYRQRRSHAEFVTSLEQQMPQLTTLPRSRWVDGMGRHWPHQLQRILAPESVAVPEAQARELRRRHGGVMRS